MALREMFTLLRTKNATGTHDIHQSTNQRRPASASIETYDIMCRQRRSNDPRSIRTRSHGQCERAEGADETVFKVSDPTVARRSTRTLLVPRAIFERGRTSWTLIFLFFSLQIQHERQTVSGEEENPSGTRINAQLEPRERRT